MHILLITDQYPPEIRSISSMIEELAEGLSERGHQVTVLASYPRSTFVPGDLSPTLAQLRSSGVTVIRAQTFHYRKSYWLRGIGELFLPFIFIFKIVTVLSKRVDAVLMYSPPLTLTIACRIIKWFYRTRFILNVQDIFPQNAIDLGIIKNPFLIKMFERIEKKAYLFADHITTHSETNKKFLIDHRRVPVNKISTVYNWIDISTYEKAKPTGYYRRMFNVEDKFVFLLAGFLGPSQDLDFLLHVAEKLTNFQEICFVILGEGVEKEKLVEMKRRKNLNNVHFFPLVPREEYPAVVKEMDVGIACLSSRNTTPVYPGKIIGFMASAKPVIAFLHEQSDGHKIIQDSGCGYSSVAGDLEAAAKIIIKIYNQKAYLSECGRSGFDFASRYFTKDQGISALEEILVNTSDKDLGDESVETNK